MISASFSNSSYTSKQYALALFEWGKVNSETVNFGSNETSQQMWWFFEDENGPVSGRDADLPSKSDLEQLVVSTSSAYDLAKLRNARDELLFETDWWASSDLTMTQERRDYRQSLRDITNTYSSLETVIWPTKPS